MRHLQHHSILVLVLVLVLCCLGSIGAEPRKTEVVKKNNENIDVPTKNSTALEVIPDPVRKWPWRWRKNQPRPRRKRSPKTGKQKMANCRHLATMPGAHSWSARLSRWWKRRSNQLAASTTATTTTSSKDMNIAYGMAVAASLSYWDFHKRPLPDNRTSYEVLSLREGSPQPLSRYRKRARKLGKSVRHLLDEAQPWLLSKLKRNSTKAVATTRQSKAITRKLNSQVFPQWDHLAKNIAEKLQAPFHPIWEQQLEHRWVAYRERWNSYRERLLHPWEQQANSVRDNVRQLRDQYATRTKHQVQLQYSFYNWYEPTPLGYYHDTDLLIATSHHGNTLILAFAGTASVADSVTNLQTFEPVQHSGLFHNRTTSLEGSIHRGFLNAYSRVERGSVLRLCDDKAQNCTIPPLDARYGHCTATTTEESEGKSPHHNHNGTFETTTTTEESIVRKKGRRGCKIKNKKLMTILRELVTEYLSTGRTVLLTGHSLGGSLVTLHALDIIINFPQVPVAKLELWTFGGAQVSDDAFLQSALAEVPRLKHFVREDTVKVPGGGVENNRGGSQFHRFVTVSDDCKVDFVSTLAQSLLAPETNRNLHGKTARKLGGIRGSSVVHLTEPHYLLTPDQYDFTAVVEENEDSPATEQDEEKRKPTALQPSSDATKGTEQDNVPSPAVQARDKPSTTRSTLAAHSTANYLKGISRESKDHPLTTDLPEEVRDWLGEVPWTVAKPA
jgi:Lipase (class 3)